MDVSFKFFLSLVYYLDIKYETKNMAMLLEKENFKADLFDNKLICMHQKICLGKSTPEVQNGCSEVITRSYCKQ